MSTRRPSTSTARRCSSRCLPPRCSRRGSTTTAPACIRARPDSSPASNPISSQKFAGRPERQVRQAALDGGILRCATANAATTLKSFLQGPGFEHVESARLHSATRITKRGARRVPPCGQEPVARGAADAHVDRLPPVHRCCRSKSATELRIVRAFSFWSGRKLLPRIVRNASNCPFDSWATS